MATDTTSDKDAIRLVPTGSSPDFAGDVNAVVQWLQDGRSFRKTATLAALNAETDMDDNDIAQVDNIDGAWFKYDGSATAWVMHGVAKFADSSARSTAIASPASDMWTVLASDNLRYRYNGTAWMPQTSELVSYTPTFTRLTVGNGTLTSNYVRQGNNVTVYGSLLLGSTSSISAASGTLTVALSLPVTGAARYGTANTNYYLGGLGFLDNGTQIYGPGSVFTEASTTTVALYRATVSGSEIVRGPINGTAPFTWTTNDLLSWQFSYEAA